MTDRRRGRGLGADGGQVVRQGDWGRERSLEDRVGGQSVEDRGQWVECIGQSIG